MHLFSLASAGLPVVLAQATSGSETLDQFADFAGKYVTEHIWAVLLWLAAVMFILILSSWFASMMVASKNGRFSNAFKIWALYLVSFFALAIGTGIALFILLAAKNHTGALYTVIGVSVVLLIVAIAVPMKVYEFRFSRALVFLVLVGIIGTLGDVALTFVPGNPQSALIEHFQALKPEDRRRLVEVLTKRFMIGIAQNATDTLPSELVAGDRTKPLEERQAALNVMFAELDHRRSELKADDEKGIAHYKDELARYNSLRDQLASDAAANTPPAK